MDRLDEIRERINYGSDLVQFMGNISDDLDWLFAEVERLRRIESAARGYDEILAEIEVATKADALTRFQTDFGRLEAVKRIRRAVLRAALAKAVPS
jgi:hypothetical protein